MAATKSKTKKAAPRKRAPAKPKARLDHTLFPPGTKVGAWLAAAVGVERAAAREPFGAPLASATVAKDGSVEFAGLGPGQYVAAGPVGESYAYAGFSVKEPS